MPLSTKRTHPYRHTRASGLRAADFPEGASIRLLPAFAVFSLVTDPVFRFLNDSRIRTYIPRMKIPLPDYSAISIHHDEPGLSLQQLLTARILPATFLSPCELLKHLSGLSHVPIRPETPKNDAPPFVASLPEGRAHRTTCPLVVSNRP